MKLRYKIQGLILAITLSANAQVGIGTNNPRGVFHIDTRRNNAVSGSPTSDQITDDVVVDINSASGINMSVGGKVAVNSSAQLALLDPNKAMLLNKVALKSLVDITTVPSPPAGMIVYNTATDGTYPDSIIPGFYYFNGTAWVKWQYKQTDTSVFSYDLKKDCASGYVSDFENSAAAMQANLADFGTIKITAEGFYIFSLRLYGPGRGSGSGRYVRSTDYLFLMKNVSSIVASTIINAPSLGNFGEPYTYTITMQGLFKKDDIVTIRLGHQGARGWTFKSGTNPNAARTSLIYWKI